MSEQNAWCLKNSFYRLIYFLLKLRINYVTFINAHARSIVSDIKKPILIIIHVPRFIRSIFLMLDCIIKDGDDKSIRQWFWTFMLSIKHPISRLRMTLRIIMHTNDALLIILIAHWLTFIRQSYDTLFGTTEIYTHTRNFFSMRKPRKLLAR